jgi:Dolichyl-phosphate-mannose-protein mannosyltransferase
MRHQSALLVERQPFGADCKRASPASMRGVFLALALLLFYVGQCVWFIGTQSFTVDEPTHIRAGIEAVRNGRFIVDDQPPLARLLYGMVLHDPKWQLAVTQVPGASVVTSVQPAPEAMAWRARLVNMSLGVVLGVLLWFSARRFFSEPAANVALALFVFSSEVIAHFSLATTDGAGTLLVFATAMQVVNWREKPSWLHTLVMGGVMGLLLLAKFYTAPIFLLAVLLLLVAPRAKRNSRR